MIVLRPPPHARRVVPLPVLLQPRRPVPLAPRPFEPVAVARVRLAHDVAEAIVGDVVEVRA